MLFALLRDAGRVLLNRFVLIYPLLAYSVLVSLILPNAVPALEPRWLVLLGVLFLLYMAFTAGWTRMCQLAIVDWLALNTGEPALAALQHWLATDPSNVPEPGQAPQKVVVSSQVSKTRPKASLPSAFGILGGFFPGIGQYFGAFAVGGLLHLFGAGLILLVTLGWIDRNGGIPAMIQQMFSHTAHALQGLDTVALQQKILKLSSIEQLRLQNFLLALLVAGASYGLWTMFTMFWPALIVFGHLSPLKAYVKSVSLCFRHLGLALIIGVAYLLLSYMTSLCMQWGGLVGAAFGQFVALTGHMYIEVLLCLATVKLLATQGQVHPPVTAQALNTPSSSSTTTH